MTRKIILYALFICTLLPLASFAQHKTRYHTVGYNVNEGLLQSNVLDIAFDQNNFCWLAFANGIQKFDGINFTEIPIQSGLPEDKHISFFKQKNGSLLLIHNQGISRYNINKNIFELVYKKSTLGKINVLGESGKQLYLFDSDANCISLNEANYTINKITKTGLPAANKGLQNHASHSSINNEQVVFYIDSVLYKWSLKENKLLTSSDKKLSINPSFIGLINNNEVVFFTQDKKPVLVKYNFDSKQLQTVFASRFSSSKSFRGQTFTWNNKKILSYYNQLYQMSDDYSSVQSEIVDFKNNTVAGSSSIVKAVVDNYDNLFLVTINDGIKKIIKNSYPIKYYGTAEKDGNYILSVYADKAANNILAGTYGNGLLIFDTLQNLKRHIKTLPGEMQSFSVNAITKNAAGDYIFLVHTKKQAYRLGKIAGSSVQLLSITSENNKLNETGYFGSLLSETPIRSILQAGNDIYLINKLNNNLTQKNITSHSTHGSLLFKNYLITHANENLSFLDTIHFAMAKNIPFANTGGVRCYATDGKNIYLGSNKGIFVTDENGKIIKQYNKQNGLPDECIYAMSFDAKQNLWCSSNKGIFKISAKGNVLQITKNNGLQENEFNTNAVYKTTDNELFFGGINGLNSFYPDSIPDFMVDVNLYLNRISVNNKDFKTDTATWNLSRLVLPYNENSIELAFIASGPNNTGQYIHQYKMEGIDKEWIQNSSMQPIRYLLPPGRYVFKMYASSYFEKDAIALKELIIIIKPPFYKTWWFIVLLSLVLIGLIVYFVNLYNKIRYGKKMAILQTQQKVQEERERMSMELHDSIGAYANAVLYNVDLLQSENEGNEQQEIMKDLRFASKDIITSLRETIWALKNENYSAQECLLRIRNFIHPFTRYYPAIHFKVDGDASEQKELHYALALNVVRIVQEAVNNAIKYSEAKNIVIKSEPIGNSWTLIITDDGKGFNQATTEYGNGIANMQKRAKEMNFSVEIISEEGSGTKITIKVP